METQMLYHKFTVHWWSGKAYRYTDIYINGPFTQAREKALQKAKEFQDGELTGSSTSSYKPFKK